MFDISVIFMIFTFAKCVPFLLLANTAQLAWKKSKHLVAKGLIFNMKYFVCVHIFNIVLINVLFGVPQVIS